MGLFSKIFGPSFEQSCDRVTWGSKIVFHESDRICKNIVDLYNEDVSLGQRGIDRQPIELSEATLLNWKCTGLVPLFAGLMQLHPNEKERVWKLVEVFIAGLNNLHPAAVIEIKQNNDDFDPYKLLASQIMLSGSGLLVPLNQDHIISQYKRALIKLKGRAEDISDLISRYEQSNTLLSNAITALALPNKIFNSNRV